MLIYYLFNDFLFNHHQLHDVNVYYKYVYHLLLNVKYF